MKENKKILHSEGHFFIEKIFNSFKFILERSKANPEVYHEMVSILEETATRFAALAMQASQASQKKAKNWQGEKLEKKPPIIEGKGSGDNSGSEQIFKGLEYEVIVKEISGYELEINLPKGFSSLAIKLFSQTLRPVIEEMFPKLRRVSLTEGQKTISIEDEDYVFDYLFNAGSEMSLYIWVKGRGIIFWKDPGENPLGDIMSKEGIALRNLQSIITLKKIDKKICIDFIRFTPKTN